MKRYLFILAALAFAALAGPVEAAGCFWVGGTGNLNDTTHWSSTTGGTISTCAASGGWPNTSSDTATFDASSGGGTITRNANWTVGTLTISAFTGTFGNTTDTTSVNLAAFSNNGAGTRTVHYGASTWTCGTANTTACTWSVTGATNLTFTGDTSTVVFNGSTSSANSSVNLGATALGSYNVVTFAADVTGNRGITMNSGGPTIATLNVAAPNVFSITNGVTFAITTMNVTGGSSSSFVSFMSGSFQSSFTFAITNAATCDYCTFRDMTVTGVTLSATNSVNQGHNSGISITGPAPSGGGGRIIGG